MQAEPLLMPTQPLSLLCQLLLVEAVFARHGIGHLAVHAILQRDYPLAQGTVLFTSTVFVLMNVLVDILYAFLDPRIRYDQ
jgi:ABC-type dipeptide/oligopeptide/nickel transport system permease component